MWSSLKILSENKITMTKKNQREEIQKISDSEWEVVRILWKLGECTATEVCDALAGSFEWSPKTVRTFLARLVQKGVASVEMIDGINHYTSLVEETTSKQVVGQSFMNRFFSGGLPSMVAHFVNDDQVTLDELAELQKVIDERRKQLKDEKTLPRSKKRR